MNATVSVKGDKVEVWAPTQAAMFARAAMVKALGVPTENITIHHTRAGGGFGRRVRPDFVLEAALISKKVGAPVKLIWSREDDTRNGTYRPAGYHNFKGGLDANGKLIALSDHFVTFGDGKKTVAWADFEGSEFPVELVENFSLAYSMMPLVATTGTMRAPRANALSYVFNCFVDELAQAAGKDPIQYHLDLLGERRFIPGLPVPAFMAPYVPKGYDTGRMADVVKAVRDRSGWGKRALPKGHGLGFAQWFSHHGYFAEVFEVSVDAEGAVKVHKAWVVGDVGSTIINPMGADQQIQGSVIDGISQAVGQKITLEQGRIAQGNFNDNPLARIDVAPEIDVHFLRTDNPPTGLGEPALPPAPPALCNAIFAATGKRVRTLPIDPAMLKTA